MALSFLEHKRAFITGAGSGISLGLAKLLRSRGVSILICDLALHRDAIAWLKATEGDGGPTIAFQQTNVTDWAQLETAFDVCEQRLGGTPEIVVAGAGVYEASCPGFWDNRDEASHYKLFDINLVHPVRLTRTAIQKMKRSKTTGVVLHISSIVAQKPNVVLPLYAASKAGLSQFVRCMAPLQDLCGVRVGAVAPGVVDTPLFRDHPDALEHMDMARDFYLPLEEVVKAMVALITEQRYPSGTILEVGDIGKWREVQILEDIGPQGRSTLPRARAKEAITLVERALSTDGQGKARL